MAGALARITDQHIYSRLARLGIQYPRLAKAIKYAGGVVAGGAGATLAVYDPTTLAASVPALLWLISLPGRVELSQHRDAYAELGRLRDELIAKRTKAEAVILSAGQVAVVQQRNWQVRELMVFTQKGEVKQNYVLADNIGSGGQAEVRRALNLSQIRLEVFKIALPDVSEDSEFKERFFGEADLLQMRLPDHPNIVRVYGSGEIDGRLFYTMENVEGTSLAALLGISGKMQMLYATRLMIKIANAFRDVHNAGIIHRDIKPDNILITKEGEPIVIDFGIARDSGIVQKMTRAGQILGTPPYMPLEQLHGQKVDQSSDLYSEGVMFFEMLTGNLPFPGRPKENIYGYFLRVGEALQKGEYPDIVRSFPELDKGKMTTILAMLRNIFANTLVPKQSRYKNDGEFIRDLMVLEGLLRAV